MIPEWLMDIWVGFTEWVLTLFGEDAPPSWLLNVGPFMTDVLQKASGLGAWFPFQVFGAVASFIAALWLAFWLIKGVRWLYGFTPFAGGT